MKKQKEDKMKCIYFRVCAQTENLCNDHECVLNQSLEESSKTETYKYNPCTSRLTKNWNNTKTKFVSFV